MQLQLFKTLWGFTGSLRQAVEQARDVNMRGIEGPAPENPQDRDMLARFLGQHQRAYIAEITTAGSYVPDRHATLQQHLDSLQHKLEISAELNPLFVTCLGGCDAWPEPQSVEFFQRAMELAQACQLDISFETHRGRSLFNPWVTQRIAEQLPDMQLTVDFSHWCVVCERLMDTELEVIHAIAPRVKHVHARVGYDQGPQVPDPRAPEYEYALQAHQSWWEIVWRAQQQRGFVCSTMTPEFGPDGYLHEHPYSRQPVADLWELNCWMAEEEKRHFHKFLSAESVGGHDNAAGTV